MSRPRGVLWRKKDKDNSPVVTALEVGSRSSNEQEEPRGNQALLRRRVSIGELPRLSRAGTVEIELYYLRLHARARAEKARILLGQTGRFVGTVLKRAAQLIMFFPFWPVALFAIGLDQIDEHRRKRYGVRTESGEVYFTHDGEEFWIEF